MFARTEAITLRSATHGSLANAMLEVSTCPSGPGDADEIKVIPAWEAISRGTKSAIIALREGQWITMKDLDETLADEEDGVGQTILCGRDGKNGYALLRHDVHQLEGPSTHIVEFAIQRMFGALNYSAIENIARTIIDVACEAQSRLHRTLSIRRQPIMSVTEPTIIIDGEQLPRTKVEKLHESIHALSELLLGFSQHHGDALCEQMRSLQELRMTLQWQYPEHPFIEALDEIQDLDDLSHPPITFCGDVSSVGYNQRLAAFWGGVLKSFISPILGSPSDSLYSEGGLVPYNSYPAVNENVCEVRLDEKKGRAGVASGRIHFPTQLSGSIVLRLAKLTQAPKDIMAFLTASMLRQVTKSQWYRDCYDANFKLT